MAGALAGKKYANLAEIQKSFRDTAPKCASEARGVPTILKK
jgi:hypothetical protein